MNHYEPTLSEHTPSSIKFNVFCSVCKATFRGAKKGKSNLSWFHSVEGLFKSAENGCHFCNIIVANIGKKL